MAGVWSRWGRKAVRAREGELVARGKLRVLTGDAETRKVMEAERQVRQETKARIEAGGVPAPVRRGKRPPRPQGDTRSLAEVSARQMAKHRGEDPYMSPQRETPHGK